MGLTGEPRVFMELRVLRYEVVRQSADFLPAATVDHVRQEGFRITVAFSYAFTREIPRGRTFESR